LYGNAQSYGNGASAYNYVYAARLDSTEKILELNEKYESVSEYLEEYADNTNAQTLIKFFFRTDLTVSEESQDEYDEEFFTEASAKFGENGLVKEKELIGLVGKMTLEDEESIKEAWENSLLQPEKEVEEDDSLSTGAIIAIVIGAVVVLAAAITIPTVIYVRKAAAKKKEDEATVNAYKRKKIDTTDDKSIDVYADDEAVEEPVVEEPAEPVVEATEEVEEPVVEESINYTTEEPAAEETENE
jgi:hypothetical protein